MDKYSSKAIMIHDLGDWRSESSGEYSDGFDLGEEYLENRKTNTNEILNNNNSREEIDYHDKSRFNLVDMDDEI